jgi:hypothetical protein
MKSQRKFSAAVTFLLLLSFAASANAVDTPRVGRSVLVSMESSIDDHVKKLWTDNPFVLLGPTRGVYLTGYGAVFSNEVNLVLGPVMMSMSGALSKEDLEKHRVKKIERIPLLKKTMRQALVDSATWLEALPANEQIVMVSFLSRYPWEDTKGLPTQILMRASKGKLLEAQRAGDAAVDAVIQVEQF